MFPLAGLPSEYLLLLGLGWRSKPKAGTQFASPKLLTVIMLLESLPLLFKISTNSKLESSAGARY